MRFTADQEQSLARDIRAAEHRAMEAIRGIAEAQNVLRQRPKRAERTKWRKKYDRQGTGKCPLDRMEPGDEKGPRPLRDDEF